MPKTTLFFAALTLGILLGIAWTRYGPGVKLTQEKVCPAWAEQKFKLEGERR